MFVSNYKIQITLYFFTFISLNIFKNRVKINIQKYIFIQPVNTSYILVHNSIKEYNVQNKGLLC